MKYKEQNYKEIDKVAKSIGLKGKDGQYQTAKGLKIDASACQADRLALGYLIAKTEGHITKW